MDISRGEILKTIFLLCFYQWMKINKPAWYIYKFSEKDYENYIDEFEKGSDKFLPIMLSVYPYHYYYQEFYIHHELFVEKFNVILHNKSNLNENFTFVFHAWDEDKIDSLIEDESIELGKYIETLTGHFMIDSYNQSLKYRFEESLFERLFHHINSLLLAQFRVMLTSVKLL